MCPEFPVLDAHKELILESYSSQAPRCEEQVQRIGKGVSGDPFLYFISGK